MICFPNAKINLGLHVVSRRKDGYHNLETIFYPVGLKDALEIIPAVEPGVKGAAGVPQSSASTGSTAGERPSAAKYRFFQTGIPIEGSPENNLAVKALHLIATEKKLPEIDIHLLKKIPPGAGLGGGSSDAACMLRLLNEAFDLGYSKEELMLRAARLGADCPFFILNRPAFASGTGDELEPIEMDLSDYTLILVKPDIMVSTKEAYAMITPRKPDLPLRDIIRKPPETWRELLKNDFELPVFKKFTEICRIKQQLYEMGAVYASMSGSGSSVFGLFEKEPDWQGAFDGHFVWHSDKLA
ncbi:4-(cytidine 5'-diphospho)-2-C-methyl-D-erythritol kinase [Proteiniphilum sp. X52]|uniref:4-(cytidine 5'-diphospho)-2-C-methyl-D-erythritol kinase n=1 Tax=Proteiniphilum sp. X52 TaxID=2382159 RepID=UPI000F0A09C1|nr:4-(cytidine 5'-diphospho)-2-C-methyl-D-erythritol kinase [Proteiniphilum sp. X52]RNC64615.1 4-(cytidine 5'-diphospho)-2-C-methyl-D-erythritol kinase [Proteiniphilum sp. X52]